MTDFFTPNTKLLRLLQSSVQLQFAIFSGCLFCLWSFYPSMFLEFPPKTKPTITNVALSFFLVVSLVLLLMNILLVSGKYTLLVLSKTYTHLLRYYNSTKMRVKRSRDAKRRLLKNDLREWWKGRIFSTFPGTRENLAITAPNEIKKILNSIFRQPLKYTDHWPVRWCFGDYDGRFESIKVRIKNGKAEAELTDGVIKTIFRIEELIYFHGNHKSNDWHKHILIKALGHDFYDDDIFSIESYYYRGWASFFLKRKLTPEEYNDGYIKVLGHSVKIGKSGLIESKLNKSAYILLTTWWNMNGLDSTSYKKASDQSLQENSIQPLLNYLCNTPKPDNQFLTDPLIKLTALQPK